MGGAALGLHPEVLFVNLLTVVIYGILRSNSFLLRRQLARVGQSGLNVAVITLVGLALAAVQLIPLAELGPLSARAGTFPYSEVAGQSFTPFGLAQLVLPYVFRGPDHEQWGLWAHWESYLYVGLSPLVLALVAMRHVRRRGIGLWMVVALVGLTISLGEYSPVDLFALLWRTPGLGWIRAPGRFELMVVLALSMLAAHGMAILQARARLVHRTQRSLIRGVVTMMTLLAPFGLAFALNLAHSLVQAQHDAALALIQAHYLSLPHDQAALSADDVYAGLLRTTDLGEPRVAGAVLGLFATLSTIMLWQRAPGIGLRRWSGWCVVLVVLAMIDLLVFGWAIHPRQTLSIIATPDPAIDRLNQFVLGQDSRTGPTRVLASSVVQQVAPDQLVPLGLQEAGGYSSLDTSRERSLLLRVERVDDELLDLLNVRYVLDPATPGPVPSYRDVQYAPRNPLVDAGAGGDLAAEEFVLSTPVLASQIRVVSALEGGGTVQQGTPVGEIILRSPARDVLAGATLRAGEQVMDWAWDDLARSRSVNHTRVEEAGRIPDKQPDGWVAQRSLSFASFAVQASGPIASVQIDTLTPDGRVAIYGVSIVDSSGTVHQLLAREKTKYQEIMRDQAVRVLENTAAFPRAFLVAHARVARPGGSLEMMQTGPFAPRDEVIVAADSEPASLDPAMAPLMDVPKQSVGQVRVTGYSSLQVQLQVDARTSAFLVLTDAFYPGWQARVDGRRWPILRGDEMFRVLQLPPGQHTVEFQYLPGSVVIGVAISLVALLVCLVLFVRGSEDDSSGNNPIRIMDARVFAAHNYQG